MSDLSDEKLRAEIRLLEEERRAVVSRTRLDILKSVAVVLGAVTLFWFIQNPDSIVNREASRDSVARERAALVLECLKEQDPGRRHQALAVVRAVYGRTEDKWLEAVETALREQADADRELSQARQASKSTQDTHLRELYRTKEELAYRLSVAYSDMLKELDGTGGTRRMGSGPVYREKLRFTENLKSEIAHVDYEIREYEKRMGMANP